MVVQELEMSCGAACIRQLLLDDGISHPEAFIRRQTDFNDNLGISVESIASTLNKLNQCQLYRGGGVAESAFEALNLTGAWIVRVKPPTGSHYIIVDGMDKELVLIRDPWGLKAPGSGDGLIAKLALTDFLEYWRKGINQVVFRVTEG